MRCPAPPRSCLVCILTVLFSCVSLAAAGTKHKSELSCHKVKELSKGKGYGEIPDRATPGSQLKICEKGPTCCSPELEAKLAAAGRADLEAHLRDSIAQLRLVFAAQAQRFDEFFKELLKTSKSDFHQMFLRTYGMLYDRNSYIFEDLFDNLERYYLKGGVNLNDALEDFFDKLYRKMFQVLNSQYSFTESYMNCISQYMEEMKPFGDVPKKLTVEIKRSFVATRTFVQALIIGRDAVKHLQEVAPTAECSRALTRLSGCPLCRGLPDTTPCHNYCLNVLRGCLAYLADMHLEWNNYINAMMMLASRLETSFNIEAVVHPIDIKISDAIMNFQENGLTVSQELFKQCGQPRLGKRNARHELNFETLKFGHQQNAVRPTTAAGTSIDRLVQSITKKIKKTKNFWIHLSKMFCNSPKLVGDAKSLPDERCWNGSAVARYDAPLVGEGIANQSKNPELSFDSSHQEWVINQQILTLQLITTKLTHAYNGLDVLWQDSSDSDWASSGSGSGSGYGNEEEPTSSYGDIYFSISTPGLPIQNSPEFKNPPHGNPSSGFRWHASLLLCTLALVTRSLITRFGSLDSFG